MENNIWNILRKELRELFRDKKSLAMMLVIPIFIPFLVLGMSSLFEMQMNKDIGEYNKIGISYEMTEEERKIAEEMKIEIIKGTEEELKQKYEEEEINLYVTKIEQHYIMNTNSSENSSYAKELVENYLNTYKQFLQQQFLQANQINPSEIFDIITVEEKTEEKENFFVNYIKN